MTKKRQFGAIRQLPSGRWQVRFRDPAGNRRAAPITFVTKAEAGRWLSGRETELFRGEWIDPTLGDITVADWSARWLASRPDLKPKTRASYESLLRSRIVPAFGGRALSSIRPLEVQEWVAGLQKQELSASRIRQATHLLGSFMKAAVNEGLIAANPCANVRLPRIPDSDIEFLTAHEVERLAAVIQQPYGPLVHLLAYGGLRFGEAAALRRGRCDLERGRLVVRESLADVSGTLSFGTTKTHQARSVVLPSFLVERLRDHLRDHVAAGTDALVFTSATGQPIRYGNFYRRVWKPATEAIGRPNIGVHVLRHTCASLLIAQGAPIKAIQVQLGHRSAELTLDRYGHLYPDQVAALASRLDDARAAAVETDDDHGYAVRRPDRGSPSDGARVGHAEAEGKDPDIIG